ncbi:MAG: TetR/AcrR family transcriptional regulator [bacterium]|nr:TetR/AcrR family transcriptional regulator [bacterium]
MKDVSAQEARILRASEGLFFRFGFQRVTTEQIANEAGVSKRTIYAFFPSKMSIVIRSFVSAGREINASIAAMHLDDPAQFERCLRSFLVAVANGSGRFSAPLVFDLTTADPRLGARLLKARTNFLSKRLRMILDKGLQHGAIRKSMNMDATVVVTLMALDCLLHPESRQALKLMAPLPETVVDVLLRGVRPK